MKLEMTRNEVRNCMSSAEIDCSAETSKVAFYLYGLIDKCDFGNKSVRAKDTNVMDMALAQTQFVSPKSGKSDEYYSAFRHLKVLFNVLEEGGEVRIT